MKSGEENEVACVEEENSFELYLSKLESLLEHNSFMAKEPVPEIYILFTSGALHMLQHGT